MTDKHSIKSSNPGKIGSVLVVGGGIGGMQAALDLADSGFKTYILEEKPAIGGVMAQLDKTFHNTTNRRFLFKNIGLKS